MIDRKIKIYLVSILISLCAVTSSEASCIYNHSNFGIAFSSTGATSGGYSSEDLSPGSSQCWYGHGWFEGYIGYKNNLANFLAPAMPLYIYITVTGHGWVTFNGSGHYALSSTYPNCYEITAISCKINGDNNCAIGLKNPTQNSPIGTCSHWAPVPS